MKLLTTIHQLNNAEQLLKNSTGLVVGLKGFSSRETSLLSIEEFKELSELAKSMDKEVYISLKPMLYNAYTDGLTTLFSMIKDFYYTGVIVGDIGYYYLLSSLGVKNIIYNPETLLTNIDDFNNFFEIGVKGAFVAKEINIKDVIAICENKKGQLFLTAHGHLNMFYSKRKLLKSYFSSVNLIYDYENKMTLTLEETRRKGNYPIIEDKFGTHVFRNRVSTVIKYLDELKDVDYFLIDSLFKSDEYALQILKMFKKGYDEIRVQKLMDNYNEKWDEGFLNLRTIYKKDDYNE